MNNHYTTLDQLEAAVKAMRKFEDESGLKIEVVSFCPKRNREVYAVPNYAVPTDTAVLLNGGAKDVPHLNDNESGCEEALVGRVVVGDEVKMVAIGWHPDKFSGSFWAKEPEGFLKKVNE